jgi:hypothetical protein
MPTFRKLRSTGALHACRDGRKRIQFVQFPADALTRFETIRIPERRAADDGKAFGCPDLLTDFVRSAALGNHLESFPESEQLERHGMMHAAYNRTGQAILFRQNQSANTANQQSI